MQIKRQPRGCNVCDFWRHAKPITGKSNTLYKNELELTQANDSRRSIKVSIYIQRNW